MSLLSMLDGDVSPLGAMRMECDIAYVPPHGDDLDAL